MHQITRLSPHAAARVVAMVRRAGGHGAASAVATLAAVVLGCAATAFGQVSISGLGLGGGAYAYASGLSADGSTVSGNWTGSLDGVTTTYRAFRWTAAGGMQLGGLVLGDDFSAGYGVSGDGATVVGYSFKWNASGISGDYHAMRWTTPGVAQNLGYYGIAYGTNTDGSAIVGSFDTGSPTNMRSFLWTPAGLGPSGSPWYLTPTGRGISADGVVVVGDGYPVDPSLGGQLRAFRWTAFSGMQDLGTLGTGPLAASSATAVSSDGSTIVGTWGGDNGSGSFRWTAATGMQDLGTIPGGTGATAFALNSDGSVVVGMAGHPISSYGLRAFLWTASLGMLDLRDYLTSLGVNTSSWALAEAHGISADGSVIVGSDSHESWIATGLPVPVTNVVWDDVGSGLAGVGGVPSLAGVGAQLAGFACVLTLSHAKHSAPAALFVGLSNSPTPFKGGTLIPVPTLLTLAFATHADGTLPIPFAWPAGLPSGFSMYYQYAIKDSVAAKGVALSNALQSTTP